MVSTTNQGEGRVESLVRLKTLESTSMLRELAIMHKENCSKITVVRLTYEDSVKHLHAVLETGASCNKINYAF